MFAYVLPVAVSNPQLPSWIAATETFWPTKLWLFSIWSYTVVGFLRWLSGKESGEADMGSIPGWGRSPGGGSGNPLQYSCGRIPQTEEPGRLQSIRSQRVRHDWSNLAHSTPHFTPGNVNTTAEERVELSDDPNAHTLWTLSPWVRMEPVNVGYHSIIMSHCIAKGICWYN